MKATKDFEVVFFVNVLALWCILMMHHPTRVKESGRFQFDVAPRLPDLFGLRDVECFHCDDCTLVSGSYP